MPDWPEIRPPAPSERLDAVASSGFAISWPTLAHWLPAVVAVGLAIAALGGLAVQALDSPAEPEIRVTELPGEPRAGLIDLNTATIAELSTLPGIGETRAEAMVRARSERPFTSLADLVERGILRESDILELDNMATVYVAGK